MKTNSLKKCYFIDCPDDAISFCSCANTTTYFCKEHFVDHTIEEGEHLIVSLFANLNQIQRNEVFKLSQEFISYLKQIKYKIRENTCKIVNLVCELSKISLLQIQLLERDWKKFSKSCLIGKNI